MFNQNPLTGPGAASVTTHSLEILLMLLVAFALGFILAKALGAKNRARIDQLESAVSGISAQNHDLTNKLSKSQGENENLRRKFAGAEAESSKLRGELGELEFRLSGPGPISASLSRAAKAVSETSELHVDAPDSKV